MTLTLYTNTSEKIAVSKNLHELANFSGTLRAGTSIIDPVISIAGALPPTANYAYVPEFGRYYFITDIQSEYNGFYTLYMHVDVLMTYAAQIRAQRAVIARQENSWNLNLNDGIFKTYQNPIIKVQAFPSGFSAQQYILAIAGSQN